MSRVAVHATLAALVLFGSAPVEAQQEIFETGNRLYQEEDFGGAIDAYEAVLGAGYESADLYYNLGNAYFKDGDLGRSILNWERALAREPGNEDVAFNLELARSLTVDAIQPLPRFWLLDAVSWWVNLLPRSVLLLLVAGAWLCALAAVGVRVLARDEEPRWIAGWVLTVATVLVVAFGANLAVRELRLGQPDRAIILAEIVRVQSAPAEDDDLTLFEIHEGTRVRIDQTAGSWAEVVLDDGKVGWVQTEVMETI